MPTNLISTIAQILSPDLIARIASSLGLDKAMVERTLSAGAPALLAALGARTTAPGGAAAVNTMIERQEAGTLQKLGTLIGGPGMNSWVDAGSTALRSLLGGQTMSAVTSAVGRYAGLGDVGSTNLMGMLGRIVTGAVADQGRTSGQSPAALIAAQKDNIVRALPAGVADSLGKTGMLDWLTSDVRVQETPSQTAKPSFEHRPSGGRSAELNEMAKGWVIPALAILAVGGLAWYLFSGPSTKEVAKSVPPPKQVEAPLTTGALPEPRLAELPSLDSLRGIKVGDVDFGTQVTDAVNGVRSTLAGIHDQETAQAALDPLKRYTADFGELTGLANQLSPEMKKTLAGAIAAARPTLDVLFSKALQIPGVSELIKPTIDSIRTELDTLATA